ncbi:MAG: hypothetical protein ABIE94_01155, partial [archaeon]
EKMNKKGQAAMEFLMTYGWAILVVLAAIAALAYFGVLSPAKMLPERCIGPSGLDCTEKASLSNGMVTWATKNNLGYDITITGISNGVGPDNACSGITMAGVGVNGTSPAAGNFPAGANNGNFISFTGNCTGIVGDERAHIEFVVAYKSVDSGATASALYAIDARQG